MFIVWGTKTKQERLGYVAEYCVFCHTIRAFELISVSSISHVYYIPTGMEEFLGHIARCTRCASELDASQGYRAFGPRNDQDLDILINETNPGLREAHVARKVTEERAIKGSLSTPERWQLLFEPLLLLNPKVEARARQIHFDRVSVVSAFATVALTITAIVLAQTLSRNAADVRLGVVLAPLVVGLVTTVILLATDVRRFVRRQVTPMLVLALFPLNPSLDELREVFGQAKSHGARIARKVDVGALYAEVSHAYSEGARR